MEEEKRLINILNNIRQKRKRYELTQYSFDIEFNNSSFINWYNHKKEILNNKCNYCGSDQNKITDLINSGKLNSKRFNKRGRNLEVDRLDPKGNYSEKNCTLVCYFCNNDKSDILSKEDYIKYFMDYKCKNGKTLRNNYIDEMYELIRK